MENSNLENIRVIRKIGSDDDRQGKVSLCEADLNGVHMQCICKIPKKIGFLGDHEAQIIKDLNTLNLPHFCKFYNYNSCGNKLYMEYINIDNEVRTMDSFLSDDFDTAMNLIKQVLMALSISQRLLQFTHYDLHCDNVLVKSVDKNSVYLYVLDENNQFCVPTNGLCAVIIDYGYSYTQNTGTYGSLEFTELGYTPNFFDPYIDAIRFLVTTSRIARREYKIFRNVVRNIFPISESISMTSGWFRANGRSGLLESIKEKLGEITSNSILYKKCIQSLMILQGMVIKDQENPVGKLSTDYYRFSQEFEKLTIDKDQNDKLKILKDLVVTFSKGESLSGSAIAAAVPNYKNFDTMTEYMETLRNSMSGFVTQFTRTIEQRKKDIYSGIKLNTEQTFGALDFNFHSEFKFDTNTKIYMWKNCEMTEFTVPGKYIRKLNKTLPPLRGTLLYDIYLKGNEV